jgi:hypothetical protein
MSERNAMFRAVRRSGSLNGTGTSRTERAAMMATEAGISRRLSSFLGSEKVADGGGRVSDMAACVLYSNGENN